MQLPDGTTQFIVVVEDIVGNHTVSTNRLGESAFTLKLLTYDISVEGGLGSRGSRTNEVLTVQYGKTTIALPKGKRVSLAEEKEK
jgi:hypothetical protein